MYVIIDLETGNRISGMSASPNIIVTLPPTHDGEPDGGTAHFKEVGQTEPGHAPRYRMVEVVEATPRPDYPVVEVSSEREFDGEKEIVRRTYAPDLTAFTRAIEDHIEATAQAKSYSSAVSCASYVADPNPVWAAEAQAFIAWRSAVWTRVFELLAEVQMGKRAVPTIAQLIAELPEMEWLQG